MQLPEYLKSAISHLVSNTRTNELAHFSAQLSERYRGVNTFSESLMRSDADYFAYLTTRLPATYGAMMRVLQETQKQLPETIQIKSLLDVGAGPGTAFFVANEFFTIEKATLIEKVSPKITDSI